MRIKQQFLDFKNKEPLLVGFLLRGAALLIIWNIFYTFFRYSGFVHDLYEWGTKNLTHSLLWVSKQILSVLGFEPYIINKTIRIGDNGILLDRGCLARNLMALFVGFIMAYPGKFKSKLWFVPAGLAVIYILNTFRISGLLVILIYHPKFFEINHHLIFKAIVYAAIFFMWIWWIKRYGVKRRSVNRKTKSEE